MTMQKERLMFFQGSVGDLSKAIERLIRYIHIRCIKVSDNLLDFENSINAELEAQSYVRTIY